jgi:hypothetical protein
MSTKGSAANDLASKKGMIPFAVQQEVEVAAEGSSPPSGDVEEEAFFGFKRKVTTAVVEQIATADLKKSLDEITDELHAVLENQAKPRGGFALDSFTVGIQVEGKGKIALVAEVGGHASIELTFKRC